ncbi:hypothetical protein CCR97_22815 [Rhodoplanes elegans]|uniref:Uncharacterized protein n=1 Tax=Rhodoplanes elegans TaxID=29408 RepID=A0A327K6F5_9BRAD|nr:hypothetical protein [Rhodoplanes elegans]RAI34269.1 hypothetical protein CH338_21165 [Rhodoplanes elegans]
MERCRIVKRSWVGALVLVLCAMPVVAGTPELPANPRTLPMQFSLQEPAAGCGTDCAPVVFAAGMITADTPRRFEAFATERNLHDGKVVLDSDGGSVLGALALGRAIRRLGLDTTVGRAERAATAGKPAAIAPANCESMCAFVLLGGVHRDVPARSRVLVHQIWLGDRRDDAVAASYSAEDLVLVQRDIGAIVRYTAEMAGSLGGGAELIEIALRIPPWEPMRLLSRDELKRIGLDQAIPPVAARQTSAAVTPVAIVPERAPAASERGWTSVDGNSGPMLVRRHPLTVEGERIGSFDLSLSCGDVAGTYGLTYAERRQAGPGGGEAVPLDRVRLWIEQTEVTLDVVSSRGDGRGVESVAIGTVAAPLVRTFAAATTRSLSVLTGSGSTAGTTTRIGNAGLGKVFGQLETACGRGKRDTHARLEAAAR